MNKLLSAVAIHATEKKVISYEIIFQIVKQNYFFANNFFFGIFACSKIYSE